MKRDISVLRGLYSQHRVDIVNLLQEEFSQFKSVIDAIKENMGQININEELKHLSPQENDCRDVHISPDIGSDTITKVYHIYLFFNVIKIKYKILFYIFVGKCF